MKVVCFDLDDTLYKEIDYLHSAYRLIARNVFGVKWQEYYVLMLRWYEGGDDVFQKVIDLAPGIEKGYLFNMYRYDVRDLCLSFDVENVLASLKAIGVRLGLITDGRSLTQRNKIKALGLGRFFDERDIVISEEFGSEKPSVTNYEYFMKLYPGSSFAYVADNPQKDFVGANRLGWTTICLLDDGRNIHRQDFEGVAAGWLPKLRIVNLSEMVEIL